MQTINVLTSLLTIVYITRNCISSVNSESHFVILRDIVCKTRSIVVFLFVLHVFSLNREAACDCMLNRYLKLEHVWNSSWKNNAKVLFVSHVGFEKSVVSKVDSFDTTCLDSMLCAWYPKSCLFLNLYRIRKSIT